ncbi:MAG: YpmA family protein [Bacillota bacterium]|jgi:hypothetical protein
MEEKKQEERLNMIAQKNFARRDDMYEIVDFLNKNLKEYGLMFGLKIDDEQKDKMTIKIYEV